MSQQGNDLREAQLTLRPVRTSDLATISRLAFRSKAHWGYDTAFMEACKEELTLTEADLGFLTVVVAEVDNEIAGFYALEWDDDMSVEVYALFVDPPFIGQGVGRQLMADAERVARSQKADRIIIQSDPNALGFYEAVGATKVGEKESYSVPGRFLPLLEYRLNDR